MPQSIDGFTVLMWLGFCFSLAFVKTLIESKHSDALYEGFIKALYLLLFYAMWKFKMALGSSDSWQTSHPCLTVVVDHWLDDFRLLHEYFLLGCFPCDVHSPGMKRNNSAKDATTNPCDGKCI